MSLELKSGEHAALQKLWAEWSAIPTAELEATFGKVEYVKFLDVMKYLQSIGLQNDATPLPPKLNILVSGGLRFTLVGDAVIAAYCRDNSLKDKPFHVIRKNKQISKDASDVNLKEYDTRVKARNEIMLPKNNPSVVQVLQRWESEPKAFRYIQRYTYESLKGIKYDLSCIRENEWDHRKHAYKQVLTYAEAGLSTRNPSYEVEVEATRKATLPAFLTAITHVLRGMQGSYFLVRNSVRNDVLAHMRAQTGAKEYRTRDGKIEYKFPGSQPVTLCRENIESYELAGTPNIRFGDYNVTDKADGLRCLMLAHTDGRLYMIDRNTNVYATNHRLKEEDRRYIGAILDGEWITTSKASDATTAKPMSLYCAFDVFNGEGGADVSARPFMVRGTDVAVSRLAVIQELVSVFNRTFQSDAPLHQKLKIESKEFFSPLLATAATAATAETPGTTIFDEAKRVLLKSKDKPYNTDGLIFTPNNTGLVKNRGTWAEQFKWKPAEQNSVDFLVVIEPERDTAGNPMPTAAVMNAILNENTNQIVRYKRLNLFVGTSTDRAYDDPRETVLNMKPLPQQEQGAFRPAQFVPTPPDAMASVAYVAINAGATDPAGATNESHAMESLDDTIYCESGDPITSGCIVEMRYDPERAPGWRWIPMHVRWDKTERFMRKQTMNTMNSEGTAQGVWDSIHNPVTAHMISTGDMNVGDISRGRAAGAESYYLRKTRHFEHIKGLRDFHNKHIKGTMLLNAVLRQDAALIDMSVGQAGDIHKWLAKKVGWVLGCDIAASGLTDKHNGAYRRYMNELIKSQGNIARMVFVQADSSKPYNTGQAGIEQMDVNILHALWGNKDTNAPPLVKDMIGFGARGFDVASLMFSLHYFFNKKSSLDGLLYNISQTVKKGGYFVGCCFDGDTVLDMLRTKEMGDTVYGKEDGKEIWSIQKQYEGNELPPTESGLGKAINVNFISIGEAYTEYLVSWTYFVSRMQEIGMVLAGTELFSTTYDKLSDAEKSNYVMADAVKQFSFLNRWFIFRRESGAPTAVPIPTVAPVAAAPIPVPAEPAERMPPTLRIQNNAAEVVPVEEPAPAPEAAPASELVPATGPIITIYSKALAKDKDEFKVGDKHWRRYIGTYFPYKFRDLTDSTIVYPSFEAAYSAEQYKNTTQPKMIPQLFSTAGSIHQTYQRKRIDLIDEHGENAVNDVDEFHETFDEEAAEMRKAGVIGMADAKKQKLGWNQDEWEKHRMSAIVNYLRQRMDNDSKFARIIAAIAARSAKIVYTTTGKTDLATDNLYGRAIMQLAGLQ
jgi:hypothetical protein